MAERTLAVCGDEHMRLGVMCFTARQGPNKQMGGVHAPTRIYVVSFWPKGLGGAARGGMA